MRKETQYSSGGKASDFSRFMLYVRIPKKQGACWDWVGGKNAQGYGHFSVKNITMRAHRWLYIAVMGEIDDLLVVRHKCDNPSCVNPAHMEVGTASDNMKDMVSRGRNQDRKGDKHPMAIMNESQVCEIRKRNALGEKQADLAREFGISPGLAGKIIRRERWKHI